jgi:hypothetical protein
MGSSAAADEITLTNRNVKPIQVNEERQPGHHYPADVSHRNVQPISCSFENGCGAEKGNRVFESRCLISELQSLISDLGNLDQYEPDSVERYRKELRRQPILLMFMQVI